MKIVHTADWHLGKLVQGVYMTEDQRYILEQFIEQMKIEKPDVIIVAGDLYDRSLPPVEAVRLLDDVLAVLVMDMKIPVIVVAGNHDSPGRLQFASSLLERSGYYVAGHYTRDVKRVELKDKFGAVHFHLVPFTEPSFVRDSYADATITTHDKAMQATINTIVSTMDSEARHIFVGHAFVTVGGEQQDNTSDSERPLTVGGVEYVNAKWFEPFHYTALGHLHRAHKVGNNTVRYAGTPLKYSASEHAQEKGYYVVNMNEQGEVDVVKRKLIPLRDMRQVEGTMEEILQQEPSNDYVFIKLMNDEPVASPMERVRTVYPNALHVARDVKRAKIERAALATREQSDIELFEQFYEEMLDKMPADETKEIFLYALNDLANEAREGGQKV